MAQQTINGFISDITTDGSAVHHQPRPVKLPESNAHKSSLAESSSSSSSERCQKISISSVHDQSTYDDDSSVVDSDSDNENLTIATVARGTRTVEQCEAVELQDHALGSVMREMGQLQNISNLVVNDSSNVSIGSKFIFEDGSKITLVVKDKSGSLSNGYANGGFAANGDLEENRKPIDDLTTTGAADKDDVVGKFKLLAGHRKYLVLLVAFAAMALMVTVIMLLNLQTHKSTYVPGDGDDLRKNIPIDSTIGNDLRTKGNHALRHVTRDEWLAQPALDGISQLELPAGRVIISHSATDVCTTQAACTFRTRLIQTFHIESRHWSDIGYNFLVGGDGNVYDGRGWDQEGAHTKGYNRGSIGVSFIGTFNAIVPPERQLNALKQLLQEGVDLGKLTKDYKMFGARQVSSTESPGAALFEILKTMPHFSDDIE